MLRVDVVTALKGQPFGLVGEFLGGAAALLLIGHDTIIHIHIVDPERALFRQRLNIDIVSDDLSVGLQTLWSFIGCCEMIFTLESLVALDGVFELELYLGVVRAELETHLVDELRRQREVRPALQILVALMLQFVLPALVELDHHVPDVIGQTLVAHIVKHIPLKLVRKECEWLRLWRC